MVAQNHSRLAANALQHARAFLCMDGDALKVMVGHHAMQLGRVEVALRQAVLEASHRHTCCRVRVHDTVRPFKAAVQSSMHHKTSRIDLVGRAVQHLALHVDLDQIGGRDLAVVQAKRVDQKVFLTPGRAVGQAQRDVVVNHLCPTEHGKHAVASCQFEPGLPFVGMDPRLQRRHHRLRGWKHRDLLELGSVPNVD